MPQNKETTQELNTPDADTTQAIDEEKTSPSSAAQVLMAKKAQLAKKRAQPPFPSSKRSFPSNNLHASRNSMGKP